MRLILHIGMHKTASTTIQKRLQANNPLLRKHGYIYISEQRKSLLKAVLQGDFEPWRDLIRTVAPTGLTPIFSHEALSHVLCRTGPVATAPCSGDWLLNKLADAGVSVTIIAFIRDQPSYLNSHYTQHVKRFATSQSLAAYTRRAMRRSIHKTSCDPEQLFGWIRRRKGIRTSFFPYGRTITPPASLQRFPNDPFAQLIGSLGIPERVSFQAIDNRNTQPGDLAVRTALHLSQELKSDGIRLGKKAQRARTLLTRESKRRGWSQTPYVGLDQATYNSIRDHFAEGNNRFSVAVWGCTWQQIFPLETLPQARLPSADAIKEIEEASAQIRRKLLARPNRFQMLWRSISKSVRSRFGIASRFR